jgi:hypothetical protein
MTTRGDSADVLVPDSPDGLVATPRDRWIQEYGLDVAEQLREDRRYSLIRVGDLALAYSHYDAYVRALGHAWRAGSAATWVTSAVGADLPDVAPRLSGVNLDLDLDLDRG